ncbi:MAG: 4Fe-4S binding protein [Archangiaceae bacterium]|nr:4Fe-4S binding protein [Archangiaceae bacterium]
MTPHPARSRLQPGDIVLRHARSYTWVRRACLAASFALTFAIPAWHLHALSQWGRAPGAIGPPGALSLFGLELIDPLAVTSVALARGPSLSLVLLALPALALVLVLGRFFCGWVCPYVPLLAASNSLRWLLHRVGLAPLDLKLPRRTSWAVLVAVLGASALSGAQLWPLVYPPSVIGREAFRAVFFGGLGAGALLIAFAFAFDSLVSRAGFCRSLCPGGAMFSLLGAASPITVKLEREKCTGCTACDVVCNLGQSPMTGRIDEGCERCGKCVASCPTSALRLGRRP